MKGLFAISLLFLPLMLFAQGKYDANWVFGDNAGVDFSDTANIRTFKSVTMAQEACASISDSSGQLLFYLATDSPFNGGYGYSVRDSHNNLISGGDSTIYTFSSVTNGLTVIPSMVSQNKWFILQLINTNSTDPSFGYSIVERDSSGFRVTVQNRVVLGNKLEEKMALVKHANGRDWWLLVHQSVADNSHPTSRFYRFLISNDSIVGPWTQNIGSLHHSIDSGWGEMTFSRNGAFLALAALEDNIVELYRFDRCTGLLSDYTPLSNISQGGGLYGCEFSPSGSKLYITEGLETNIDNVLYQFNLDTTNIEGSKKIIYEDSVGRNWPYQFCQLQVAPDNKVYLSSLSNSYPYSSTNYSPYNIHLSVINHPDSSGAACDFQLFSFPLADSSRTYLGLPNFPNYNLGPLPIYQADAGNDTTICRDSNAGVVLGVPALTKLVYRWQPSASLSDTTIAQPIATPDSDTYYVLTVTDTAYTGSSCNSRQDTVYVQVVSCDTTGIGEVTANGIKVYPNPATNLLVVECHLSDTRQQKSDNRFVMYNIMGQIVLSKQITDNKTLLDVSTLPQGLYLYRIGNMAGKVQVVR